MSSRNVSSIIKRCKVCIDAGMPESVFSTHFVKDKNGKVCCPTLLSQKCLKCNVAGHTSKFCAKNSSSTNKQGEKKEKKEIKKEEKITKKGIYDSLYMSDSDDDDKKSGSSMRISLDTKKKEEFPLLTTKKIVIENPQIKFSNISYADKLKIPVAKKDDVDFKYKITIRPNSYSIITNISEPTNCNSPLPIRIKDLSAKKSWADYSDSDCDSDCDSYYK